MFRKQPVVETGTQEPAKTASTVKWTGGSLLGGKAISVLVWGALLCAPISLFVAHGAQVAVDRVKATPISQGATTVPALQQSAGSFALGYVGAWLSATQNDSTALDAYLSANQLGVTLASLALGWVGERAFASLIEFALGKLLSAAAVHTVASVLAFILITFLHTVLGELAPKSLAIQKAEWTALWSARPLHLFYVLFYPLIWVLNSSARLVLRLFGLRAATESAEAHSAAEPSISFFRSRPSTLWILTPNFSSARAISAAQSPY